MTAWLKVAVKDTLKSLVIALAKLARLIDCTKGATGSMIYTCPVKLPLSAFSKTLRASAAVGDDDVKSTVTSHISQRHRIRLSPDGKGLLGLEGAVAIAQQHADRVTSCIG